MDLRLKLNKMKRGIITLVPFKWDQLFAGVTAVIDLEGELNIVQTEHLTPDQEWVVKGDNFITTVSVNDIKSFAVIDEESSTKHQYPVPQKDWKKLLNRLDKTVDFQIGLIEFHHGNYMQGCKFCKSQFVAAKKQNVCEDCCAEHANAVINFATLPESSTKRARMIAPAAAKEMAREAHKAGTRGDDFETWYHQNY